MDTAIGQIRTIDTHVQIRDNANKIKDSIFKDYPDHDSECIHKKIHKQCGEKFKLDVHVILINMDSIVDVQSRDNNHIELNVPIALWIQRPRGRRTMSTSWPTSSSPMSTRTPCEGPCFMPGASCKGLATTL